MNSRTLGFLSLLAVIGASIVFGMVLGGKLNAPEVTLAAPPGGPVQLAPAVTGGAPGTGFADVVEASMPAVVSVRSTDLAEEEADEGDGDGEGLSPEERFWHRFFGSPNEGDPQRRPQDRPRVGEGTGFVISEDGYILTNNHVVENADSVRIGMGAGKFYEAEIVGTDPSIDLALLKIDPEGEQLPTLPLGDSDAIRVGAWVVAIGNPLEFEQTVTVGVVSAKNRRVPIGSTDTGVVSFIQTDAAINFGNSGGPLLDAQGNVIGINTAIRRTNLAEGIGFALPINHARSVIEQLRQRGFVKRGYIGITMNQDGIDETAAEWLGLDDRFGVLVDEVAEDGPAEIAGVRAGDVIRKVDGEVVRDNLDLIGKIAAHQPGDDVRLEIYRRNGGKGETMKLRAELVDRDEALRANANRLPDDSRDPVPETRVEEAKGFGLTVEDLDAANRRRIGVQRGVRIKEVEYGSEAQDKGIVPDMVVVSINNQEIETVVDWMTVLETLQPGEPCKVDLLIGPDRRQSVFLRMPAD